MNPHDMLILMAGARHQGISLEDRVTLIEKTIITLFAPECCGRPADYNSNTGSFICESCLRIVGEV